ncbi:hypothetical protein QCM80_06090 [Bradyrhizobium sp. SSUT112]|uniref:hypothetical protein n=1 Tax=Bradyrhizobium sp. SSUT112 TaxID=3040604 RepID=UPI002449A668|nr:hypothetical protein [Bradyrhizobium sp. SSUT112]MDH2350251.1 hypothetical protein [Bradyrhizobium sp. SSUT112]
MERMQHFEFKVGANMWVKTDGAPNWRRVSLIRRMGAPSGSAAHSTGECHDSGRSRLGASKDPEQEVGANLEVADKVNRTGVPSRVIGADENISHDRDYPFCGSGSRTAGSATCCYARNIISRPNQGSARQGRGGGKERLDRAGMGPRRQWKAPVGYSSESAKQQCETLTEIEALPAGERHYIHNSEVTPEQPICCSRNDRCEVVMVHLGDFAQPWKALLS